ncbi:MAG: rhomboid family intramembrane serine protease [Desulfobacteraceae bacterium]|nr:rhomboid family intramembrane serine protease [Desulfobacteraceae bacterium]
MQAIAEKTCDLGGLGFKWAMLILIYSELSAKGAEGYGLILSSAGIFHKLRKGHSGWEIWIQEEDLDRATFHIKKYAEENPAARKFEPHASPDKFQWITGAWASVLLAAIYLAVGENRAFFNTLFGASAREILNGELYRTVTALLLHADASHLLGNMAAMALFGTAVCSINGTGGGWFLILMTGISGNYFNAVLHQAHHTAVGASTAVFGAVGMLAAHQFGRKLKRPGRGFKAWLPLAGGLGLLAMMGTGEGRVDITAHLFGFISGLVFQGLFDFQGRKFTGPRAQWVLMVFAGALVLLSCVRPLLGSGD